MTHAPQPLVYVDFDDVLCETARTLMGMFNARYGKSVIFEEIFTFDLNVAFGLTDAQTEELVAAFHDPAVLGSLEPIADAVAVLRAWHAAGIDVDIVTGRPPSTCAASQDWLRAHGVPFRHVIFVDKYGRGHREAPGVELHTCDGLQARGYVLAVDDSFAMATFLAGRARVPVALYSRPWNLDGDEAATAGGARIYRCSSWQAVDRVARAVVAGCADRLMEDYRWKC
jgi:uncharacterized protein